MDPRGHVGDEEAEAARRFETLPVAGQASSVTSPPSARATCAASRPTGPGPVTTTRSPGFTVGEFGETDHERLRANHGRATIGTRGSGGGQSSRKCA
jgi:hypothetical protein